MNYFSSNKVKSPIEAYLLGFFYADAGLSNYRNGKYYALKLNLSVKDKAHIFKIKEILKIGNIKPYLNKKYPHIEYSICSVDFVEKIKNLGIKPRKTWENDDWIFKNIPNKFKWHFIRGYFDGDGCINKMNATSYRINIVSLNKKLLKTILSWICKDLGFFNKNLRKNRGNKHHNYKYNINFGGNIILKKIRKRLYKDDVLSLSRKKKLFFKI